VIIDTILEENKDIDDEMFMSDIREAKENINSAMENLSQALGNLKNYCK
jgi:hypothetical protein